MIDQDEYALAEVQIPDLDSMISTGKQMLQDEPSNVNTIFVRFYKQQVNFFEGDVEPAPPQGIFFAANTNKDPKEKYFNVSSIFHVYGALNATSGIVINYAKYGEHSAMIATVISHEYAYIFIYPYEQNDGQLQWLDDMAESSHVDDFELDSDGTDIVSMYYYYSHLNHTPYPLSDIYSYLSANGITFEFEQNTDADVPYVDFSEFREELINETSS